MVSPDTFLLNILVSRCAEGFRFSTRRLCSILDSRTRSLRFFFLILFVVQDRWMDVIDP